jgi:hypothetical protein
MANAACFDAALTETQRSAVQTYLLAVIAGGSLDPETLLASAKCFVPMTQEQRESIQAFLLCAIVNK